MKKFTIVFEATEEGELTWTVNNYRLNEGFSSLELLGLLDMVRADMLNQCMHPERFVQERVAKTEEGELLKKLEVKDDKT